jgi:hypothetical protein
MILVDIDILEPNSIMYTLLLLIILLMLMYLICYSCNIKSWDSIVGLYAILLIFLWSWGVTSQIIGYCGIFIIGILTYIQYRKHAGVENE